MNSKNNEKKIMSEGINESVFLDEEHGSLIQKKDFRDVFTFDNIQ